MEIAPMAVERATGRGRFLRAIGRRRGGARRITRRASDGVVRRGFGAVVAADVRAEHFDNRMFTAKYVLAAITLF